MIVEPTLVEPPKPTNEDDDIGDMYSKWIHHHMTLAMDSSPNPIQHITRTFLSYQNRSKNYGLPQ